MRISLKFSACGAFKSILPSHNYRLIAWFYETRVVERTSCIRKAESRPRRNAPLVVISQVKKHLISIVNLILNASPRNLSNTNSPLKEAAYNYRTFDFELSVARPETKFSFTSKGSALCRPWNSFFIASGAWDSRVERRKKKVQKV